MSDDLVALDAHTPAAGRALDVEARLEPTDPGDESRRRERHREQDRHRVARRRVSADLRHPVAGLRVSVDLRASEAAGVRRVVHSVRTAAATGATTMILTNGAGGIRETWKPIMLSETA